MNDKKPHAMHCFLFAIGLAVGVTLWTRVGNAAEHGSKAGDVTRGAQQWANNCSRCHNMREPTEFRDDLWKPIIGHMRIRAGLTGQQSRDILAFLQASNYSGAAASVAATTRSQLSGQEIYSQTCVACHGADGQGALPGVPDLTAGDGPLSKPQGLLLRHIIEGFQSPGSPMAMPPVNDTPANSEMEPMCCPPERVQIQGSWAGRCGRTDNRAGRIIIVSERKKQLDETVAHVYAEGA